MKEENSYKNIHQHFIDGCKAGDSKAQFEIYKLYYKAMYNTSLRIVGNEQEAEDIMQESFFKAFDKIATYKNEVSFGAWLRRIVVNTSIDALKKKRISLISIEEAHGVDTSSDEETEFEVETIEMLKNAIEQLPEGYKLVLNLHLIEELDHDEIAATLGIAASTSRSQLARAKQKLIEIIKRNKNTK
jgi:RNA polymerase sigma-70 factor (ECF subfamily)